MHAKGVQNTKLTAFVRQRHGMVVRHGIRADCANVRGETDGKNNNRASGASAVGTYGSGRPTPRVTLRRTRDGWKPRRLAQTH